MAKTIMVSNDVYAELKMKKAKRSFSELITDLLHTKRIKTGGDLRSCLGLLKKDKEFKETERRLKKGWKAWSRRYA